MGTAITRFRKGSGFHGNREKAVSREITQIEVGFIKPGKIRNFQKWKNDNNNNKLPEWFREA